MLKEYKLAILNSLFQIKIVNIFNLLIYLLPFSLIRFPNFTFLKFPYAYILFFVFSLFIISDLKEIKFKFNLNLFILFFSSIIFMTISYLMNDSYSYASFLGIIIRLIVIIISTNLLIDIKSLFWNLQNSLPLYLIPLLFTQKFNILNLFDFVEVNSNLLAASFTSIVLLVFVIKKRFGFKISLMNYISIAFSSVIIYVVSESRGVLLSLFLGIFILNSSQGLKKLFQEFKISKKIIKVYIGLFLTLFLVIISIFTLIKNTDSNQSLSRYYFFNINSLEQSTSGLATSDLKRFYLGTYALSNIFKKPLIGYGSGNSQEVFRTINIYDSFNNKRKSLHNSYLTIAYDFGIPSLILLILFCRKAILMNFKGYDSFIFNLLISFYLLYGLFSDSFAKNYFIFVLTILCIGYSSQKKSKI